MKRQNLFPNMLSGASSFDPFGMLMRERTYSSASYRFGFNGKEKTDEINGGGNVYDYGFRIYNPRLGRFLSVDPLAGSYPWYTPYQFAGNKPIIAIDLDGLEEFVVTITPDPQFPQLKIVTVYKIAADSRKEVNHKKNDIEYRIYDVTGAFTVQQVDAFNINSKEAYLMNRPMNIYVDEKNTKQITPTDGHQTTARDALIPWEYEADNDPNGKISPTPLTAMKNYGTGVPSIRINPESSIYYKPNSRLINTTYGMVDINIKFNTDQVALDQISNSSEALSQLDNLAKYLNTHSEVKNINIIGNYSINPSKYKNGCGNACLAQDRANTMMEYLKTKLSPEALARLNITATGNTNTSTTNDTNDQNAQVILTGYTP